CVGPRGDGYDAGRIMSPAEAEGYHAHQIGAFARAGADPVTAITMTNASEAIGVTRAAKVTGMPVVISFTLETDGRLPTGQALHAAIEDVDAATDHAPAYFMINCAHPLHFQHVLAPAPWMQRVRGIRANASKRSHAELDAAPDLDAGDPAELGAHLAGVSKPVSGGHGGGGAAGAGTTAISNRSATPANRPCEGGEQRCSRPPLLEQTTVGALRRDGPSTSHRAH